MKRSNHAVPASPGVRARPRANLAARAGAWSAAHRRQAIVGWLVFVIVAATAGAVLGTRSDTHEGNGQSGRVDSFLRAHFPQSSTEAVLIQARRGTLAVDPGYDAAVSQLTTGLRSFTRVSDVHTPSRADGSLSPDGRSALVTFSLGEHGHVTHALDLTAATQRAHPHLRIAEFGDATAEHAIDKSLNTDFARAEQLSLPITLLILVLAFGALVAAGVPMLLGLSAVGASLGLVGAVSHLVPMDDSVSSVVLLVGLAVGVDYSLFYLRREREERAAGATEAVALQNAAATSGQAVLVSALTVMTAMAGMFFAGSRIFTGMAVGSMIVVAAAGIGSVTVLPAVLAALGPKIEKGRIPLLHRLRGDGTRESRVWSLVIGGVTRRPLVATVLSAGVLLVMAVPVLTMHTALPGVNELPQKLAAVQTYNEIQRAFPGGSTPATVGIEAADVRTPAIQREVSRLIAQAHHTPGLLTPITTSVSPDHRAEQINVPLTGKGWDKTSDQALSRLRSLVDSTVARAPGADAGVTGDTASTVDFDSVMNDRLPIVFAFVLGMAFLLLLVTFRSIVIPVQAIVLNLLSVGAAYGVLTFVFQGGHFERAIGFSGHNDITAWLPLFMFVVLFGLSMDYHVFILSRVREAYGRGESAREAVRHGVISSAGVVSSAALVMVAVFAIFATLGELDFKEMGIGLATAIAIDATVIRGVLLPATLSLLGDRAWYLPSWLGWLPGGDRAEARAVSTPEYPELVRV